MSNTPFEIAQARLKAVEKMDRIIARQRQQAEELESLLLDGANDLFEAMRKYEGMLIGAALKAAGGRPTGAAKFLNISYQTLTNKIASRHPELIAERTIVHKRKAS